MESASDAVRWCALADLPNGGAAVIDAVIAGETESLLLLRRGDEVRAFLNICPHAGRRLDWAPGRVLSSEGHVICAAHGATFRIPDGLCTGGPCRGQTLREVPVVVREGEVYVADKNR